MAGSEREWDTPEIREQVLAQLDDAENVNKVFELMLQIERGFSDPWQLTVKLDEATNEEETKRRKIQLFKFWHKAPQRAAWLKYIESADLGEGYHNLSAGLIAATILDKSAGGFAEH